MNYRPILGATVAILFPLISWSAQAFECPTHIAKAQATINKGSGLIISTRSSYPMLAESLLREARMNLAEARFHHAKSGRLHHVRSIVKANEALGYARGAYILSRLRRTSWKKR